MSGVTPPIPESVPPHGGVLVNRVATPAEAAALRRQARSLPALTLSARETADLELLAHGAYSPLQGFMTQAVYAGVLQRMRLADGLPWSLPITVATTARQAKALRTGAEVALKNTHGVLLGLLRADEAFPHPKEQEALAVYGTTDRAHPGVAGLFEMGEMLVGGPITWLGRSPEQGPAGREGRRQEPAGREVRRQEPEGSPTTRERLMPAESRREFLRRGWRRIVGFQTRNPIHRAHEYIQKCALETMDGLLIHPLVGETKGDDVPADVRMQCYRVLLQHYYPRDRVVLSVLPAAMRYAGPREAIFHAIVRKNYGCTHFIVGRDHAGVGTYYGPFAAQAIFDDFAPGELGVTPMFFDHTFYCRACTGMASSKTCPHPEHDRVSLSGTAVRAMLREGRIPPPEFTRPEVARILIRAFATPATPRRAHPARSRRRSASVKRRG